MGIRFTVLILVFSLAYAFLFFHLYSIQIQQGDKFLAQAQSQDVSGTFTAALRGAIYFTDREGNRLPVALNRDFPQIYAVPKVMDNISLAANALASVLNVNENDLRTTFADKTSSYASLFKKADDSMVNKVKDLNIKGVYVQQLPDRFYPFGPMAAHLLGFVGPNQDNNGSSGRYGLEKFYNDILGGKVNTEDVSQNQAGQDLTLTLDPNIQKEAERILKDAVVKYGAKIGTVMVQDPASGKILAMSALPSFDPNNYSDAKDLGVFLNPLTEKIYEPGSVFKVLTMAAGIDSGKITPDTAFVDTGKLVLNGKTIQNWDLKAHGRVTMTNVIEQSLNTGAAFAERTTGDAIFTDYLKKFGLGEKTGVDLPGEVKGDLRRLKPKAEAIAFATASFGQGVAVTPLQLINAVAAIANGGLLMRPYANANLKPMVVRRVISQDTAHKVAAIMVSAVDKAEVAHVNGYTIAGKTGTAQIPNPAEHNYYTDKYINTYVGFGPTKDPKFIILIRMDEPKGAALAGTTVVPAFRELAQFILNYYNIPPDRLGSN